MRLSLLLPLAFAALATGAAADIVKLKNGETLEGIVASKDKNYVTVKVAGGEVGFDLALVDSIDDTKGPKTDEDLAKLTDAARKRAADQDAERAMAVARRDAAVAAEASAKRSADAEPVDASAAAPSEEQTMVSDLEARRAAIEEVLDAIPTRRERDRWRRELLAHYFGPGNYDPILRIAR